MICILMWIGALSFMFLVTYFTVRETKVENPRDDKKFAKLNKELKNE